MMFFDLFFITSGASFVFFLILWFTFYDPALSIGTSLRRTNRLLKKEYKIRGDNSFVFMPEIKLFRVKRLSKIWINYCEDKTRDVHPSKPADIRMFFGSETLVPDLINAPLLNLLPFVFFTTGLLVSIGTYYYKSFAGEVIITDQFWTGGIIAASAVLAILMAIASKVAVHNAGKEARSFVRWMQCYCCDIPDLAQTLSSLITDTMQPFVDKTSKLIDDFVLAAGEKQIEALDNLASKYAERTEEIYSSQLNRISAETTNMADLQSEITVYLKEAAMSSRAASGSVEEITSQILNLTSNYRDNLSRLEEMNQALAGSISEFKELASYIRQNYSSEEERIGSLAASQKEILEISARANESLKHLFEKDSEQYASTAESLKAVSEDILKAGEALRNSYSGISIDISQDIEKVFASFDENLAGISLHLSRSIQELQEVIDDLPESIRRSARDL